MDDNWRKLLLAGLGAAAVTSVVVGLVIVVVAWGAGTMLGLGEPSGPSGRPSLYLPPLQETATPRPSATPSPTAQVSPTERAAPSPKPKKPKKPITLVAQPERARAFERIYLTGDYRGGDGRSLQVQRFQGGWSDFPVTVIVQGGRFSTYVLTGAPGPNKFRVLDRSSGRSSNPVTVVID